MYIYMYMYMYIRINTLLSCSMISLPSKGDWICPKCHFHNYRSKDKCPTPSSCVRLCTPRGRSIGDLRSAVFYSPAFGCMPQMRWKPAEQQHLTLQPSELKSSLEPYSLNLIPAHVLGHQHMCSRSLCLVCKGLTPCSLVKL